MKAVSCFPDRQVGYRRIHMRMQLQPCMPTPCALHMYVHEIVGDQLSYRDGAVDVGAIPRPEAAQLPDQIVVLQTSNARNVLLPGQGRRVT